MKFTIVCLFATVAAALGLYTDKFDSINFHEILENDRLRNAYVDCLLDEKHVKCTAEGKELKSHMQDGLETGCANCTQKQKEGTEVVMSYLINNKPDDWAKLTAKYDPTGKYSKKYEKEYKKLKA